MLCQYCNKNQASVTREQIIDGVLCSANLCRQCDEELFGDDAATPMDNACFPDREKVCAFCGLKFGDYEKSGLLGCPSCYDVFNEQIMPYVARIQGKTQHVGKAAGAPTEEHDRRLKLQFLQVAMEEALGRGDYASAGKINKQMQQLKRSAGGGK